MTTIIIIITFQWNWMEKIAMTTIIIIITFQWNQIEEIAITTIIIITFQWNRMEEIAMTTLAHRRSSTQGPAPQTGTCHTHWHTGTQFFFSTCMKCWGKGH